MVGLLDIAPVVDTVDVNGSPVNVPGVSLEAIVSLLRRYPVLYDIPSKGITIENVMATGPDVVAAVIAAGCGQHGNSEAEQIAKMLNLQAQIDLLAGIFRRTMPKGVGPFIESLNRLMAMFTDPVELMQAKIEQMKSSPKPSRPLSEVVTPLKMSGQ